MPHRFWQRYWKSVLMVLPGCLFLLTAIPAFAAGVEETVARNFLQFLKSDKAVLSVETLQGNMLEPSLPPVTVGHLFHLQDGGYLLVSPDRTISPIKAYSLSGDFSALPPAYRQALLSELEFRVRVAAASAAGRTSQALEVTETGARWDFLLNLDSMRMPMVYTQGEALIKTAWDQVAPYNRFLPTDDGHPVLAGCVNVALGQVMRYHQHPAAGQGVVSYDWTPSTGTARTLKAILFRPFNWSQMPAAVDRLTPEYQADEVALLLRDLGIANRTHFGVSASSASLHADVLIENFGYSTSLDTMGNEAANFDAFHATIRSQIEALQPVLLTFPGHMTVADGYRDIGAGWEVHVNMGWGGYSDNFYFLDRSVAVAGFGTNPGDLDIQYNIKPCHAEAGDCAVSSPPVYGDGSVTVTGDFTFNAYTHDFPVYLNGPTTLQATRGWVYSNVGFFVSLFKAADDSMVSTLQATALKETPIEAGNLPAGKYIVRVSPCSEGSCYPPAAGYNHFTVTLATGNLNPAEKAAIDAALDKAPVIGGAATDQPLPNLLLDAAQPSIRRALIDARDEDGDAVALTLQNSNPEAVSAVLVGNTLELTPTGTAKVSSLITVTATANGKTAEKAFMVLTGDSGTAFGKAFTIGGLFTGQNTEAKTQTVILDGACMIKGNRPGYGNQAFFSKVFDSAGVQKAPIDGSATGEIASVFSLGIYRLEAAVCVAGGCYPFATGADNFYSFTVACPDADEGVTTIAGLLGIDLTGAFALGDLNGDNRVTIADVILALRILSGLDISPQSVRLQADVNADGKIGLAEVIFSLQKVAALRN